MNNIEDKTIISASILGADLANLERDTLRAAAAGCEYIHFDVMDGVFVPNISFGLPVLKAIPKDNAVIDVHLMIINPIKYVKAFAETGADIITVHLEADTSENIRRAIEEIKACGKKAGLAIKPKTPIESLMPFLNIVDMVLIMTVEPGFGGQGFIDDTLPKISNLSEILVTKNIKIPIQVDGGINDITAEKVKKAGASILVAGAYIYNAPNMTEAVNLLLKENVKIC